MTFPSVTSPASGRCPATGLDCIGVTVTFVVLVHGSRLDGTWSTNTGIRGDFNVTKH
jgi:hypothetical protein